MIHPSGCLPGCACRPARSTWWIWQAVSACQRPRVRALCCGRRATSTSPSASWSRHEGAVGAADGQVWSVSGVRCDTDSVLCLPARLRQQQQACDTKHSIQTQGHALQSMSSNSCMLLSKGRNKHALWPKFGKASVRRQPCPLAVPPCSNHAVPACLLACLHLPSATPAHAQLLCCLLHVHRSAWRLPAKGGTMYHSARPSSRTLLKTRWEATARCAAESAGAVRHRFSEGHADGLQNGGMDLQT